MTFKIERDGDYLICEEHQVARFKEQGWVVVPEEEEGPSIDSSLGIKTSLVELTKDGDTRLYEVNQVSAAKAEGWTEGGLHAEQPKDHDSRPGTREGQPSAAKERGPDLGKPGSGSGPSADAKSDDESSEGREDLIREAIAKLDPADDEHWTAHGSISVHALRKIIGYDVTKAQIEAAAPYYKRPEITKE